MIWNMPVSNKIVVKITLMISSKSSVTEKMKNCFLPQNQPRTTEYSVDVMSIGDIIQKSFIQRLSVKRCAKMLGKHIIVVTMIPLIIILRSSAVLNSELIADLLDNEFASAVIRDRVTGMPELATDKNSANSEKVIWYTPRISAPNVRDKKILNKNDMNLVTQDKIVTTANALTNFLILNYIWADRQI